MKITKFQQGGNIPAAAPAPAQDPILMLAENAMAALESQDCGLAMQVCEGFVAMLQQAQGPAPVGEPVQGEPVFKKGGKIVRRQKKC